jgi:hypothetical protein
LKYIVREKAEEYFQSLNVGRGFCPEKRRELQEGVHDCVRLGILLHAPFSLLAGVEDER